MIRGLYASASGMAVQIERQEVIANNLANASSSGFRRQLASFHSLAPVGGTPPSGPVPVEPGVRMGAVATDHAPGAMLATGNPLDVALDGPGTFVVSTPAGPHYTRNGAFRVGPGGRLETLEGDAVLGRNGEIILGRGPVEIGGDGTVTSGGKPVDALQVVDVSSDANGLVEAIPVANPRVRAGYLESSNVNTVHEMVQMIAGYRAYEANQRALQMQDKTLEQAAGEVARV